MYLVWGVASLVSDLAAIARVRGISYRLSWERIAREVSAISDGQIRLAEFAEDSGSNADAEAGSDSAGSTARPVRPGPRTLIRRLAADTPPGRVPSRSECRFYDISFRDCPERMNDNGTSPESTTDNF